jgi:hypothetical protein
MVGSDVEFLRHVLPEEKASSRPIYGISGAISGVSAGGYPVAGRLDLGEH